MENILSYTLDTAKECFTIGKCKELDERPMQLTIYDHGAMYDLTGATLKLNILKNDGTFIIQTSNIDVSENVVTINPLSVDATRVPGNTQLELSITKNGLTVSTFTFNLIVLPSVMDGAVQSGNIITILEQLNTAITNGQATLSQVNKAITDLNNLITSGGAVKVVDYNVDKAAYVNDKTIINKRISDIAINVDQFGAVGDGAVWDTTAFQNAFQYAKDNNIKKIKASRGKTYRLGDIISITQNDLEFDGDNCLIKWDKSTMYDTALSTNGWDYNFARGVFHLEGSKTATIASITGKEYYYSNQIRFSVDSTTSFSVGDYVILKLQTGTTWGAYDENSIQPKIEIITKIIAIGTNLITLEYNKPAFNYTTGSFTGSITKVNTLDNCTIKNVKLYDNSPFTNTNGNISLEGNIKLVSLVSSRYASNLKTENLYGENTKLPLVLNVFSYNINIDRCKLNTPACIGGGEGYLNQNAGCSHINVTNSHAFKERHLVDFTSSAYGVVENCYSSSSLNATFICHGNYEHDITFKNCQGSFGFANSGTTFGNVNKNIILENCKGYITGNYIENLRITNSSMAVLSGIYQVEATNSDLVFQENSTLAPTKRGKSNSKLNFTNCNIVWITLGNRMILDSYDYITLKNVDFKKDKGTLVGISLLNCGIVNVTECPITDIEFRVTGNIKKFTIDKCDILLSDAVVYALVNTVALTSNTIVMISNNNFYHGTASKQYYACKLFNDSNDTAGIKKTGFIVGNTFNGQFMISATTTGNVVSYFNNINIGAANVLENAVAGENFINQNNILNV